MAVSNGLSQTTSGWVVSGHEPGWYELVIVIDAVGASNVFTRVPPLLHDAQS